MIFAFVFIFGSDSREGAPRPSPERMRWIYMAVSVSSLVRERGRPGEGPKTNRKWIPARNDGSGRSFLIGWNRPGEKRFFHNPREGPVAPGGEAGLLRGGRDGAFADANGGFGSRSRRSRFSRNRGFIYFINRLSAKKKVDFAKSRTIKSGLLQGLYISG